MTEPKEEAAKHGDSVLIPYSIVGKTGAGSEGECQIMKPVRMTVSVSHDHNDRLCSADL